jgi:DNA (cytosine-5)-methyltransferase 1
MFSGIGGIDLGLERAGMKVIWQAENNPYAAKVLAKHWPDVPNLGDVTKITWEDWTDVERPDVICGGYPCQPFSHAGKRGGENDPRHLWPHMARCLRVLRPDRVLLENVPGHLSLGFGTVLGDLAALGYDAEWEMLPASAFSAPHLRWRLFIVAYAQGVGNENIEGGAATGGPQPLVGSVAGAGGRSGRRDPAPRVGHSRGASTEMAGDVADAAGGERPPGALREPSCGGNAWAVEPDVGRVAHGVPNRVDRLRCLGNAVVPQVAEYVGRCIAD